MNKGRYEFAGKVVEVNSLHELVHAYCADYATDAPADLEVTVSQDDIEYERSHAEHDGYADGYLEELAVYRKISEKMPFYDTILFHGSVVAVDGAAYMFTAASGTGKSTHAELWRESLGDGTPYDGKHRLSNKIAVPLKAICILTRADTNSIVPVTKSEAYPMLIQQAYRPNDVFALRKTLTLVDKLAGSVRLYRLGCNMDIEAAGIAYEGMNQA